MSTMCVEIKNRKVGTRLKDFSTFGIWTLVFNLNSDYTIPYFEANIIVGISNSNGSLIIKGNCFF